MEKGSDFHFFLKRQADPPPSLKAVEASKRKIPAGFRSILINAASIGLLEVSPAL